jgi:hypothetical protein
LPETRRGSRRHWAQSPKPDQSDRLQLLLVAFAGRRPYVCVSEAISLTADVGTWETQPGDLQEFVPRRKRCSTKVQQLGQVYV